MTFGDLIERARTRCRETIAAAIAAKRGEGLQLSVEPTLRNKAGEIVPAPNGLKLPLRYDYVWRTENSNYQSGNTDSITLHVEAPLVITWEHQLQIEIHSIAWDYLYVTCGSVSPDVDCEPLRAWFLRWFDMRDSSTTDEQGLHGVVHFISDPVFLNSDASFFVDLGSASSDSLAELFDTLILMGVRHCRLGAPNSSIGLTGDAAHEL